MTDLQAQLTAELGAVYLIERELGGGGMSRVFAAEDRSLGRKVVIKVLPEDLGGGFNVDRFRREIRMAATLQHPHIVPLLTAGGESLLYYTMPLVQGESLRARLEREGELPVAAGLRILRDVADALAYAHQQGIVHRDIKPDNVLIAGGNAVVTDFGVAKALAEGKHRDGASITSVGLALGTPAYMAPEQAAADPHVDHRADIYAFGAMAYEMFTSAPPFAGSTAQQVLAAQVTRTPEPISIRRPMLPPAIAALIMKCLEKSPADRWQSAEEIGAELERIGTPGASTPTVPMPVRRARLPLWMGITAASVLMLAAAGGWAWYRASQRQVVLDSDVIAVLPFRVTGADATYGEGMVDLLAAKLTGEGGPRATDPQSVMSAWRSAGGSSDLPRDQALGVARRLGAGKILLGSIVGTPNQLALSASVVDVASGKEQSRGDIAGSPDSLMVLVDRLAAQVLAGSVGASGHQLRKLTSTSLPALRAYLGGQAAYRHGAYEDAIQHYQRAVEMDSTFALAAIGLASAAHWIGQDEVRDTALALAERLRSRLVRRDAAFLDMKEALANFPTRRPVSAWTEAAQRLVTLAPESAEGWYDLGDSYFHLGALLGLPLEEQRRRAEEAFQRSAALDSGFAAPIEHLIEIAAVRGDTASLRTLAARYFQIDSTGDLADFMRWRVAVGLEDTASRSRLRARFGGMNLNSLIRIAGTAILDGVGVEDAESASAAMRQYATTQDMELAYAFWQSDLLINLGKPTAARPYYDQQQRLDPMSSGLDGLVWDALYGDGDTLLAMARVRSALPTAQAPIVADPNRRRSQYQVICTVGGWKVARGDTTGVGAMLARLEHPLLPTKDAEAAEGLRGCATAIRASLYLRQRKPEALELAQQVDTSSEGENPIAKLLIAGIREQMGDTAGALGTVRKRRYHWNETFLLAPLLREEGRLAALTGDRDGAIRAYQHYVRLREGAEPRLQPQVAMVREELAKLVGEQNN